VVRPDVAGVRVARAETWLTDASRYFDMPPAEFVAASKERDLALFYLFLAMQECIDLAAHWVADEGWQPADDAGSTFDVLAARGVIEAADAAALRAAAGLRNRIAQGCAMLDYQRVQTEAKEGIPARRSFLHVVARAAGL
jgi:uncharacterized protein YutE (UPF0331/DUF86 family)